MSANAVVWLNRQWLACLLSAPGLALAALFEYITNAISANARSRLGVLAALLGALASVAGCATTKPAPPYLLSPDGIGVAVTSLPKSELAIVPSAVRSEAIGGAMAAGQGAVFLGPLVLLLAPFTAAYGAANGASCDRKLDAAYPSLSEKFSAIVQRDSPWRMCRIRLSLWSSSTPPFPSRARKSFMKVTRPRGSNNLLLQRHSTLERISSWSKSRTSAFPPRATSATHGASGLQCGFSSGASPIGSWCSISALAPPAVDP